MGGRLQALPLIGAWFQDITPNEVRTFWQYMTNQFHITVVNKDDDTSMKLIAQLLDALKITNKDDFLQHFVTTLGHRIYTPFVVGVPQAEWSLWSQVEVCIHECQHIHQYDQAGTLEFAWDYVTDHTARAHYEAEAYTCSMESYWWRFKRLPNVTAMAQLLSNYGCTAADIAVVAKCLGLAAATVRSGAVVQYASQVGIAWLNRNVPRLHTT
jgi:hypothetical protein